MPDNDLPDRLLRWPVAMAEELLSLPDVMRDARRLVRDLSALTKQLSDTTQALSRLMTPLMEVDVGAMVTRLGGLTDGLEARVNDLTAPLDRALSQVENIERSTTELRNAAFALLRRLPGARGVVTDAVPTATDEIDRA